MDVLNQVKATPVHILFAGFVTLLIAAFYTLYAALHLFAPKPRAPLQSETVYITTNPDGTTSKKQLPCWHDRWLAERHASENKIDETTSVPDTGSIEPAEVRMSVVIPAYNEETRILPALEEAVKYLDVTFGRQSRSDTGKNITRPGTPRRHNRKVLPVQEPEPLTGYEIIIVNDGSKDRTMDVVLDFSRKHGLHDILRVVTLEKNRGKGGGVTHGLRHVRGEYAVFADADGASKFSDLGKLMEGCEEVEDGCDRGVAIGSRGHLVGSEAVVKRSALRNFLMRSFHLVLMILTPPATSRLRDTQCGFKLFSRAALPHIVPYMHAEGWIFDIEMLMLAESAPAVPVLGSDGTVIGSSPGIKVAEVPIDWHEVDGSKLNVIQDSIRMAVGLAVLRASWMIGVYRRRLA
ncbi:putative dolichyl-phosphate beta-glucosyltransferase [Pseudomassariella vexata]|uniref:dolichyl-phosphate beta-glucosyltransferase n=1 Tax=Pseudomassariella vexata TaxID=1141098 RepID=A0A1Y2E1S6_9PEZI|nr:putative dolichyl-phosphate beta-glucosyltransferase [Pseudomassariella vexata]ORY65490.1 putative dolichyl-phosphate beta-glucosyltransferase [Pseudomassariella vexata]